MQCAGHRQESVDDAAPAHPGVPHLIVLCVLLIAWFVITVIAWFVILFTGSYPQSPLPFALGVMRWTLRVEAYLLLLVDEYPPFTLE